MAETESIEEGYFRVAQLTYGGERIGEFGLEIREQGLREAQQWLVGRETEDDPKFLTQLVDGLLRMVESNRPRVIRVGGEDE
jgi:hypothetical protein